MDASNQTTEQINSDLRLDPARPGSGNHEDHSASANEPNNMEPENMHSLPQSSSAEINIDEENRLPNTFAVLNSGTVEDSLSYHNNLGSLALKENEAVFGCKLPSCNFVSSDIQTFVKHTNTHHNPESHHCDVCNVGFASYSSMLRHRMLHLSTTKTFTCLYCSKCFVSRDLHVQHMIRHKQRPYMCPFCCRTYSYRPHLKTHISRDHFDIPLDRACRLCGFISDSPDSAKAHFALHQLKQNSVTFSGENRNALNETYSDSAQAQNNEGDNSAIDLAAVSQNFKLMHSNYSNATSNSSIMISVQHDLSHPLAENHQLTTTPVHAASHNSHAIQENRSLQVNLVDNKSHCSVVPSTATILPLTLYHTESSQTENLLSGHIADENQNNIPSTRSISTVVGSTSMLPQRFCHTKSSHIENLLPEQINIKSEPLDDIVDDSQDNVLPMRSISAIAGSTTIFHQTLCHTESSQTENLLQEKIIIKSEPLDHITDENQNSNIQPTRCVSAVAGSTTMLPQALYQTEPSPVENLLPEKIVIKPEPPDLIDDDSQNSNVLPTSTMELPTTDLVETTCMTDEISGQISEVPLKRKIHRHSSNDEVSSEDYPLSNQNILDPHANSLSRNIHSCFRMQSCEENSHRCPSFERPACSIHGHLPEKRLRLSETPKCKNSQNDTSGWVGHKIFYTRSTSTDTRMNINAPTTSEQSETISRHTETRCKPEPRGDTNYFNDSNSPQGNVQSCSLTCQYCEIIFPDQTLYLLHRSLHSEINPMKCNLCGKCCKDKYDFNSHIISRGHY